MRKLAFRPTKEISVSFLIFWATVAATFVAASPFFRHTFIRSLFLYGGILVVAACLVAVIARPTVRFMAAAYGWVISGLVEPIICEPVVRVFKIERILEYLGNRASRKVLKSFLRGFCSEYVRTTPPKTIAEHYLLAANLGKQAIQLKLQRQEDIYTLTVVTLNRTGLAADITGVLAAWDMNIARSPLFVNSANVAVGSFQFTSNGQKSPAGIQHLLSSVYDCLSGRSWRGPMRRTHSPSRPEDKKYFQTLVHFDDSCSRHSTRLDIMASDYCGLLCFGAQQELASRAPEK
jgi:predicted amino acid-binding ACT domain protein